MKILHHDDIDGRSAANTIYQMYKNKLNENDFFEMNYTKKFPVKECKNEEVFIVDFSIQESNYSQFLELYNVANKVIWIDHHHTSLETIKNHPWMSKIPGRVFEGICGAALTYMYLHGINVSLENIQRLPRYLQLIDDFDCWKLKLNDTMNFKYGIEAHDHNPTSKFWNSLAINPQDSDCDILIKEGKIINRYNEQKFKEMRESNAYESKYDRLKCLIINADGFSQLFGNELHNYDFCCLWNYTGKEYSYSIYSDQTKENAVDCSEIAKKYGGGGHPGASGFQTKELVKWCIKN